MNIASEMMRQEYAQHELEGGEYDDETTKKMARRVLLTCVPHIIEFMHTRVVVEAPSAHILNTNIDEFVDGITADIDVRPIEGLHVQAKFKNVEFQPIVRQEDYNGPLFIEQYDLFAVVRPQYIDPEPDAIVFGDEVMVPFSEIALFQPSELLH
jgi:hypothetical protein